MVAEIDGAAVTVEFEGALVGLDFVGAEPHHLEALGRDDAHVARHAPACGVVGVVAEVHATEVDGLGAGIVNLYPAVEIGGWTHGCPHVGGHDFIDDQYCL